MGSKKVKFMAFEYKNKKILLDVPYYSQYLHVQDEFWKPRACGIACLKMAMDNFREANLTIDDLINEANKRGGFGEFGWIHDFIVEMARELGFNSHKKEWKSEIESVQENLIQDATQEFIDNLSSGCPIIVPTAKSFSEKNKFHQVLLTGFEIKKGTLWGFYYHDPDSLDEDSGKHNFVPIDVFKNYWRRMAIYVKI